MKQKDIALFLVVGIVSAIFSVVLSNFVISPAGKNKLEVEKIDPISSQFTTPAADDKYFNKEAINPTKIIKIGDGTGSAVPFNGARN